MDVPKPLLYLCGAEPRRVFVPPRGGTYLVRNEFGDLTVKEMFPSSAMVPLTKEEEKKEEEEKPTEAPVARKKLSKVDSESLRRACLALVAEGIPVDGVSRRFRVSQWRIRKWVQGEKRDAVRRRTL